MDSPFYCNPPIQNSIGVGSEYGTAYRFGFFLETETDDLDGGNLYYRVMVGNPDDKLPLSEVSCRILASLFVPDDAPDDAPEEGEDKDPTAIVKIYKYENGPIVIFAGDKMLGTIKDGDSNDILWGKKCTYKETISSESDQQDRISYLTKNIYEKRILLYELNVNTTTHNLSILQRKEYPSFPRLNKGYSDYSLSFEEGVLYLRVSNGFVIHDLRANPESENEGSYGTTFVIKDDSIKGTEDVTFEYPEMTLSTLKTENEIVAGNFLYLNIVDEKVVPEFGISTNTNQKYYPLDLLTVFTDEAPSIGFYAEVVLPKTEVGEDGKDGLSFDFEVTIHHIPGDDFSSVIPETGEVDDKDLKLIVPLCVVKKDGTEYVVEERNRFETMVASTENTPNDSDVKGTKQRSIAKTTIKDVQCNQLEGFNEKSESLITLASTFKLKSNGEGPEKEYSIVSDNKVNGVYELLVRQHGTATGTTLKYMPFGFDGDEDPCCGAPKPDKDDDRGTPGGKKVDEGDRDPIRNDSGDRGGPGADKVEEDRTAGPGGSGEEKEPCIYEDL